MGVSSSQSGSGREGSDKVEVAMPRIEEAAPTETALTPRIVTATMQASHANPSSRVDLLGPTQLDVRMETGDLVSCACVRIVNTRI